MSDQPQIDPALAAHLDELLLLAREIGAEGVWIVRQPGNAYLYADFGKETKEQMIGLSGPAPYRPDGGLLVVLRFPASDGGAAGVEVK